MAILKHEQLCLVGYSNIFILLSLKVENNKHYFFIIVLVLSYSNAFVNKMLLDWYLNQYLHVFPALQKLSSTGNDRIKNLVRDKEGLDGIFVAVALN